MFKPQTTTHFLTQHKSGGALTQEQITWYKHWGRGDLIAPRGKGDTVFKQPVKSAPYDAILKQVEKDLGHDDTTFSSELDTYGRKHIKGFKNSHSYNLMPKLTNGACCIVNLDHSDNGGSHWVSVIRDGKRLCVYDSYGRRSKDILSKLNTQGLKVVDSDYDSEQGVLETNCGHRALSWLLYAQKHGVDKALLI